MRLVVVVLWSLFLLLLSAQLTQLQLVREVRGPQIQGLLVQTEMDLYFQQSHQLVVVEVVLLERHPLYLMVVQEGLVVEQHQMQTPPIQVEPLAQAQHRRAMLVAQMPEGTVQLTQ